MDWLQIQTRLKELGFDPGPLDGIYGRLTKAAVAAFQKARKIPVRYPGTVDLHSGKSKTIEALFGEDVEPMPSVKYPWMDEAFRKMGLHETYNYTELSSWLRGGSGYLGDPRRLPWCGDFVETAIAKTLPDEPMVANPYGARNWLKFGVPTKATVGAVAVFWRGSRSGWKGHVGFFVGQSERNYQILGGNQSNRVSVVPIAKYRLLGARWPSTFERQPIKLPYLKDYGKVSINEY